MDRLALILADMLRSALAWEQEHGQPFPGMTNNGLTSISKPYTLQPPGIITAGEKDDHTSSSQN
jgi:hypothetical protein